jgi:hypothetical protein
VKTDADYGNGARWLSVVAPEDPDGAALLLELPDEASRAFRQFLRDADKPSAAFTVDDCRAEYERLNLRGVTFTLEPTTMPYGGTDAVFDDGCGNLICIHQD